MRYLVSLALLALVAAPADAQLPRSAAPSTANGAPATPEGRDDWQRAPDIFAAAGLRPGSRVADLGAGEGWLTTRLATHVGPTGRVFAADISENALRSLSEDVARDSLSNIELILSEPDDPRLPYGTLDAVIIVNAYHEMVERVAVLEGIKRALRPGGTLVIVDSPPADSSFRTRSEQTSRHSLALDFARDDLEAHGFELVSEQREFVENVHDSHRHRQWMLVARRPQK